MIETKTRKTRRRGRNEGSIYQRADGRWEARISLPNGKRRSYYGATREAVRDQLQDAQAQQGRGLLVAKSMTVGAWGQQWLRQHVADLRPATVRSYTQVWTDHIVPYLGSHRLDKLTPAHVHGWQVNLRKAKGARTCQLAHATLRAALGRALRLDLLARNVATRISPVRPAPTNRTSAFDAGQAKAFLAACEGHRYEALFTVALAVGLRLGEGLGLRWTDVDLDKGAMTIRQQLQRVAVPPMPDETTGKSALRLVPVKTRHGERRIPLPAFAVTALRAHRKTQAETRLKAETWHDGGFVFTRRMGDRSTRPASHTTSARCW